MKLKFLLAFFIGVLSMSALANQESKDEHQITSTIESFSALADQNAFEYLGRLFAPKVTVDYTSLFGGEASSVDRKTLMQQWAALLPGFDVTHHSISHVKVHIAGDKAMATADITASHFLGDKGFWQISSSYDFHLIRHDNYWQINFLKINAGQEKGSRDVLQEAGKHSEKNLRAKQAQLVQ
ncbi:nuclear transport factor 2 family protein [Shewanella sp. 202IG2-18]|uniref:nuclear transport factor 2 family protein n=1 Tax=Parashewanella hymeniacidonis TaxID=2807618 RepID=UPI00196211D0|nr:nuclear transport factor 2 family protein [Parashewanella hymeniacidonis]MBM7074323.1 nuclear transport factor 2 family protein [Parashewanella hymeniacidonis]